LLQLQPENYQFVNPIVLLEMSRLNLLLRSPELLQAVKIGLSDTGGFSACPATNAYIQPSMDSITQAPDMLMDEDNRKFIPLPHSPAHHQLIEFLIVT
jgi:hypothetical protein